VNFRPKIRRLTFLQREAAFPDGFTDADDDPVDTGIDRKWFRGFDPSAVDFDYRWRRPRVGLDPYVQVRDSLPNTGQFARGLLLRLHEARAGAGG